MRICALPCSLLFVLGLVAPTLAQTPNSVVSTAAFQDSALAGRIHDFVVSGFHHGVPYKIAHDFGPEGLPILARMLDDDDYHDHRDNIVTTIAWIGDPQGFPILRSFLLDRFSGEVDIHTFQALAVTPSVMGAIRDSKVTDFLVDHVDPAAWKEVRWSFETNRDEKLRVLLSKTAINGLSLAGTSRAGSVLAKLKKKPYSTRQVPNIEEGIKRNAEIASKGLEEYMLRVNQGPKR
jgi:hypothetical protein